MSTRWFSKRKISWIAILLLLVTIVLNCAGFFQVQRQLVSPLIAGSLVEQLSRPYLTMAVIGSIALIIAFALHYFSRYIPAIIVAGTGVLLPQVYLAIMLR